MGKCYYKMCPSLIALQTYMIIWPFLKKNKKQNCTTFVCFSYLCTQTLSSHKYAQCLKSLTYKTKTASLANNPCYLSTADETAVCVKQYCLLFFFSTLLTQTLCTHYREQLFLSAADSANYRN